ncbi:MAG: DUF393 domain-containing protein [Pseudomonadota bacterium]
MTNAAAITTNVSESADPKAASTVFFDGACPVCRREIETYQRMAGAEAMEWVDVSAVPEEALPEGKDRAALLARFTVRRADGELADGAAGFLSVWRAMPRTAGIAKVLDRPPVTWIAEGAYRAFLVLRRLWRRA